MNTSRTILSCRETIHDGTRSELAFPVNETCVVATPSPGTAKIGKFRLLHLVRLHVVLGCTGYRVVVEQPTIG